MNFRISNQKISAFIFLCFFTFFSLIIMSNAYAFKELDLNNDGYPDIVFSNRSNSITYNINSYIYWGSPKGFDQNLRTDLPTHGATANTVADINNDGYLDIVFCNSQNDITYNINSYIYWGSATGYDPNNLTGLPTHKAFGASVADLNNDGYKDIIFSNLSDDVTTDIASYIYWGSAMGFDPNLRTELPTQGALDNSVSDLNNDGYPDIVFSSFFSGRAGSYYYGTFMVDSYIYWGCAEGFDVDNVTRLPTYGAHGNTVADLNSDGYPDIIFSNHCNDSTGDIDSYIYWGSAAGYSPNLRTGLPTVGASDNSVADLNNDGYPDIIFSNCNLGGNRSIDSYIYWGSAAGFDPKLRTALPTHYAKGNSTADLNDDGFLDIVFPNHSKDGELSTNSYIYWGSLTGFNPNIRSELPTLGADGVSTSVESPGMIQSFHVFPGESIQEAINNAKSGDSIIVHPGTYSENIHFSGLSITVRSLNPSDPDVVSVTVIDGKQAGSVVTFGAETECHSVLNGLTLKNGKAVNGGGIYCSKSSSPKIINCIIEKNVGTTDGGGIYCDEYSSPFISGCRIVGNAVPAFNTGQISSDSQIKHGGGIHCRDYSSPSIINCHILDNTAASHGGGIYCRPDSSVSITQSHFEGNLAYRGGGISFWRCSPKIINCDFTKNSTSGHNGGGAGIYSYHSSPTIINSVIWANTAYSSTGYALGAGIRCSCCTPTITNCTIVGNSASYTGTGGALYLWGTTAVINNSIIWDNFPAQDGESESMTITYSDVEGGYPGIGNINADPLFINQNEGDLHLQAGSPCIDSGTNVGAPADDKDGLVRPQDGDGDGLGVCDMGAYEAYAEQAPAEHTLWQIGYPHGDIGSVNGSKEFSNEWSFIEKYDYYVGSDADPINHPSMPGELGTSQSEIHKLMTAELNIHFVLERDYVYGELLLIYDRYGSENDILYLDGIKTANIYGTEENDFQHFVFPLCSLSSGPHTITFAYGNGGIDGKHSIDYINLSLRSVEPIPPGTGANIYIYNGHEYWIVMAPSITWEAARQAANRAGGYLSTITTPSEQIFIETILPENAHELWLGGYQTAPSDNPSANWAWVTGEPWNYTNWKSTEPNDNNGYASEEHLGIVINTRKWNDESYLKNISGYIVESPIHEDKILYDDFSDGVLDPAWSVKLEDATGWEFKESGTNLTVTDIHPATINYESNGTWAKAILSRTIIPVSNFTLNFDFSWDSEYNYSAMQNLFVSLYSDENKILMVGYRDAWISGNGIKFVCVDGYNGDCIDAGSLPLYGSASIEVYRFGSEMKVLWDGTEIFSQNYSSPINRVDIEFWNYNYNYCVYYPVKYQPYSLIYPVNINPIGPWPPYPPMLYYYNISHFGTESVDLISISGTPLVPVHESKIFKILATGVDFGLKYVHKSDVVLGINDLAETVPVPGPPPEYSVFIKIVDLSDPFSYLYQDLREKGNNQEKWLLKIDVPAEIIGNFPDTYHPLLSWDSYGDDIEGSFKLWSSNADGELLDLLIPDMDQIGIYQTKEGDGPYFCVLLSKAVSVSMNLTAGWNMISLPVDASDKTIVSLFPDSEAVFDFDTMYLPKDYDDSLEIGKGYWIYVPTDQNYIITGIPINSYTKKTPAGWSMIGACSYPSDVFVDQGSVKALFGFEYMYMFYGSGNSMDPMEPGSGFWINLTDPANLMVSGNRGTRLKLSSDSGSTGLKSNTAQSDTEVWSLFIMAEGMDLGKDFVNKAGVVIGVDDEDEKVPIPPVPAQYTVNMKIRDGSSFLTYCYQDVRQQKDEAEIWILKVEIPEEITGSSGNEYPLLTWYLDGTIPGTLELRLGKEADIEDRPLLIEDMNLDYEYQTKGNDGTSSLWYTIFYIPDSLSNLSQYNDNNNSADIIYIYSQGFGLQWYLWPRNPLLQSAPSETYPFFSGFNPFWPSIHQPLPLDGASRLDQQSWINFGYPWYSYNAKWSNQWNFIIPEIYLMMWTDQQ
ncbi:MAG: FG-GAP-like repeat-containing protein [bacterium]